MSHTRHRLSAPAYGDLHSEAVASVGAAVDDVHPGDGHDELLDAAHVGEVLVQGHALGRRARLPQ